MERDRLRACPLSPKAWKRFIIAGHPISVEDRKTREKDPAITESGLTGSPFALHESDGAILDVNPVHPGPNIPPELHALNDTKADVVAIDRRDLPAAFSRTTDAGITYAQALAGFLREDLPSNGSCIPGPLVYRPI
jgi:hypothetical protein